MKHKHWHKVWHDRLMSDPVYQRLWLEDHGLLADLRCCAGRVADRGRTGHTLKSLLVLYSRQTKVCQKSVERLTFAGLLAVESPSGELVVPNWDAAQECPSAKRVRRFRASQSDPSGERYSNADVTSIVTVEAEAEAEEEKSGSARPRATPPSDPGKPEDEILRHLLAGVRRRAQHSPLCTRGGGRLLAELRSRILARRQEGASWSAIEADVYATLRTVPQSELYPSSFFRSPAAAAERVVFYTAATAPWRKPEDPPCPM